VDYLYEHYHERGVTVERVAEAIGVSSSHLAHLFPEFAGLSVKQYLTRMRVAMARRLLLSTDLSLEVIAERCGFCDAPHLSRVFHRSVGLWPGAMRRAAQEASEWEFP
jgi:AraC family transcriptional regulator